MAKWSVLLRGDTEVVEVVLRDEGGVRASKQCTDGQQILDLLYGWEQEYGCNAWLYFLIALQELRPVQLRKTLGAWATCLECKRNFRTLSVEASLRALELAKSAYRPAEITEARRQLERAERDAELFTKRTGAIDFGKVDDVVAKHLQLDALYGAWAEGRLN